MINGQNNITYSSMNGLNSIYASTVDTYDVKNSEITNLAGSTSNLQLQINNLSSGSSRTFIVGSVVALPYTSTPYVNYTYDLSNNIIVNYGVVNGPMGPIGLSIKGDKGDTGPPSDNNTAADFFSKIFGDIAQALLDAAISLAVATLLSRLGFTSLAELSALIAGLELQVFQLTGYVSLLQAQVQALEADVALLQSQVASHETRIEILEIKTLYINQGFPSGLDIVGNLNVIGTVTSLNSFSFQPPTIQF